MTGCMDRIIGACRRGGRLLLLAALCAGLLLGLCGCGGGKPGDDGFVDLNYPYEPDTPVPPPHEGRFVSGHGTMTFNGDGKTVLLDLDGELARRLGLPEGEQAASYEFRSGDLAPHGYIPIRYAAAMTFWLTVGQGGDAVTVKIDAGKYEDGNFYTGTNCITADRITLFVDRADGSGDWEAIDFLKS